MGAWGFAYKTMLTWVKPPPFGLGAYFRNSTEHVLFGVRGGLVMSVDVATKQPAARRKLGWRSDTSRM
jgi:N6-adenosine-specific RNA methylase IME4